MESDDDDDDDSFSMKMTCSITRPFKKWIISIMRYKML